MNLQSHPIPSHHKSIQERAIPSAPGPVGQQTVELKVASDVEMSWCFGMLWKNDFCCSFDHWFMGKFTVNPFFWMAKTHGFPVKIFQSDDLMFLTSGAWFTGSRRKDHSFAMVMSVTRRLVSVGFCLHLAFKCPKCSEFELLMEQHGPTHLPHGEISNPQVVSSRFRSRTLHCNKFAMRWISRPPEILGKSGLVVWANRLSYVDWWAVQIYLP